MASLVRHDSNQYSWWWVSHISPKNSKWLQENLTDMDVKVKAMIKLINEDADSFAKRAEMYYKKRPELMKLVEEFYRAYRALAERYDQATGALRQAHRTISEAFPNQMPSMSEESPSSVQETPEMSTLIRAPLDTDDLQKDALGMSPQLFTVNRNGTHPEDTGSFSSRKGLKQFNDLFSSGENGPRASFSDGKVRKVLNFESPEVKGKVDVSNEIVQLQQEVFKLLAEGQNLKQQISSESERANNAESEIQDLKDTISRLNSEKDTALLQYNQSTERLSAVESDLSKAQAELKKLINDMAMEADKLNNAETHNRAMQSELKTSEQKAMVQEQELEQERKEMESFHLSLQEERNKRMQVESALRAVEKQHAQSLEEANRLALEIGTANDKLNEFKGVKLNLENTVCCLKKEVETLTEQNCSSELLIQELQNEINSLKDSKNKLESETQTLKSTIAQLNIEKDAAILQHQQSIERVSDLEFKLLKVQSELEKSKKEVQMLVQELEQKREEVDIMHAQLQDERHKHMQSEAALLTMENLHSQSQDEAKRLAQDLDCLSKKLSELENDKLDLQNISLKLKNSISELNSEKDAASLQHQLSLEKLSSLEAQLFEAQLELEKTKGRVLILEQDLEDKNEMVDSLQNNLQVEGQKRMHAEAALLLTENLHSKSQGEATRLVLDLEKLKNRLSETQNSKLSLENLTSKLRDTILLLNSEINAAHLRQQQSLEKASDLESQLSKAQLEMEKTEQKVQLLDHEITQKSEKVGSLQLFLQKEGDKRLQAETALTSMENMYSQSQEEVNRLGLEIERLNSKLNKAENVSSELEGTISLLNSVKDTAFLHHQQSLVRVSDLESELSKLQAEVERVESKAQMLEQELEHKREEVNTLQASLQDEVQNRIESEAALLAMMKQNSQSQKEANRLALEIEKLNSKLNEMENIKMDLENMISMHTEDVRILREQNLCAELVIKDIRDETDALKEMKANLESEVGLHIGEKEVLQRDFAHQKEDKENLEGKHRSLTEEMEVVKTSAATLQQLLEELQIANFELKEACVKHEIEHALLVEKVQDMHKLSEEYSVLENSLSDANAEIEALRENIKALEDSESCLKDEVSSHVSEKATQALQLEIIGKRFTEISEKNSNLETSLSDANAELGELRTKLKESEESCQSYLANNSALLAEKNEIFSQLESITMILKALGGKHSDLEEKHSYLSREKDLVCSQVRDLQDQLGIKNEEHEAVVKSHHMLIDGFEKQISSLQQKNCCMDEMLEQEQQQSMSALISALVLENSLANVRDKNFTLFNECQKHIDAAHHAEILISHLKEEAKSQEEERKALLKHNDKLREGISQHMKVLNIGNDLGPADMAHDEIVLQTILHEIFNILKLKERSQDVNIFLDSQQSVLVTILAQLGLELRDLHLQKCDLEKEAVSGVAESFALKTKIQQLLELNEQLRQGLQKGSEREEMLKTELSCLGVCYQTSQDKIYDLTEKLESLLQEYQILIKKYNALEGENDNVLAECLMFEHLSLFLRGQNTEMASALACLLDDMASLSLVRGELHDKVKVLNERATILEMDNNKLNESLAYLVEILRTRLILLEFDLNTCKSVCQDLDIELVSGMTQLMQKDDELLEADEKVQFLQEKNRELCGVLGALQVAIEGAKVVKEELEKKITTLTDAGTVRDNDILLLCQANKTLQGEVDILKEKEESLTSMLQVATKQVENRELEIVVLVGDIITFSVNAMVSEEKVLELMMDCEALETSAITRREMLIKEISLRDACIDELQKKIACMSGENAELKDGLSAYVPLIASLSDRINVLEEHALSLSEINKSESKVEAAVVSYSQEDSHGLESHDSPAGALELQSLIARVRALQVVVLDAKELRDKEVTESAAKLEAANVEIRELKTRGGSHKGRKEQHTDDDKQKEDAEISKGKQGQMMKDIELDQISTCSPYGTGATLYPRSGDANPELDDEILQLWETAERDCKNETAKSSSSEHDIQAVEEVKSEYPSSELARGRDLGIDKLVMTNASLEPQQEWSKNVLERLASDAQRLSCIQASIEELKQKMEGSSKGKSPMGSEYSSIIAQLHDTEGSVLEQINFNNKLAKKAENYPALSDSMNAEQEGYLSRRKILEQAQKGSEKVARLELELQKIQYILLKLEEEHEYRRVKVSEKRTRVLLRDYLYGRKDNRAGGQKKKKRAPFCGCIRPKTKTEP